ncbi:MAG TPA: Uma2 family endonuclease [Kofleriaceae bacterium]|jgi:Uma2 family endonuclease
MVSARKDLPATYADLEALAPNLIGELIDGELFASPRPAYPHGRAQSKLMSGLGPPFDDGNGGPGGWVLLVEPELHFGTSVVVPDLAGWRRERWPGPPNTAFFELAPDWLAEVHSPSTRRLDRGRKLAVYARARVPHIWFVAPDDQLLEVLELDGDTYRIVQTAEADDKIRARPFDAIELDLARLWQL